MSGISKMDPYVRVAFVERAGGHASAHFRTDTALEAGRHATWGAQCGGLMHFPVPEGGLDEGAELAIEVCHHENFGMDDYIGAAKRPLPHGSVSALAASCTGSTETLHLRHELSPHSDGDSKGSVMVVVHYVPPEAADSVPPQTARADMVRTLSSNFRNSLNSSKRRSVVSGNATSGKGGLLVVEILGAIDLQEVVDLSADELKGKGFNPKALACALLIITTYLVVGCLYYTQEEGWTVLDSAYFCVVTATTIGYGDLLPTHTGSKLFTSIMMYFGVFTVCLALVHVAGVFVQIQQNAIVAILRKRQENTGSRSIREKGTEANFRRTEITIVVMVIAILNVTSSFVFQSIDDISFVDAFYLTQATVTSVGYGDISPSEPQARLYATFMIVVTYGCFALLVNFLVDGMAARRRLVLEKHILGADLNLDDIEIFDMNKNEKLSEAEFLAGYMVKLNRCTQREVDNISAKWTSLVAEHGTHELTYEQILRSNKPRYSVLEAVRAHPSSARRESEV